MTDLEREASLFAESVRRQAIRIMVLAERGKTEEITQAAQSLCEQAAQQKQRLGVETLETEDRFDLSELNRLTEPDGE